MKLIASFVAGVVLATASVAIAAPYWEKSGSTYICTGYSAEVSCSDAYRLGSGPALRFGRYAVLITPRRVAVNFASRIDHGVPVGSKTVFSCNRRLKPADNCVFSP